MEMKQLCQMEIDEKVEENMKALEKKVEAKKAILKEVLRTVEDENDRKESAKNRKYIRDILSCEVSVPCSENTSISVQLMDLFRFGSHVIARIRVQNRAPSKYLILRISSSPADFSIHWILFGDESSLKTEKVVQGNSILFVAIPFSAFYRTDRISLIIHSKSVADQNGLFNPSFYSLIVAHQNCSREDVVSLPINVTEASEDVDLKTIEFCEERKAVQIVQSLFTSLSLLSVPVPLDFSALRRRFPRFPFVDFDTWRLLIGTDQFDGIFVFTENDASESTVIGRNTQLCRIFVEKINEDGCTE
ncbi:unnamed protein product [Caenorhabditis sp. 36 PRJEB53466]|nr:unnamed protein product [Caenorhabditis sp. 36 PRJEB53466]